MLFMYSFGHFSRISYVFQINAALGFLRSWKACHNKTNKHQHLPPSLFLSLSREEATWTTGQLRNSSVPQLAPELQSLHSPTALGTRLYRWVESSAKQICREQGVCVYSEALFGVASTLPLLPTWGQNGASCSWYVLRLRPGGHEIKQCSTRMPTHPVLGAGKRSRACTACNYACAIVGNRNLWVDSFCM